MEEERTIFLQSSSNEPILIFSIFIFLSSHSDMIITLLIIAYSPSTTRPLTSGSSIRTSSKLAPFFSTAALMLLGSLALSSSTLIPPHLLSILQACTIPISLASKVPQMLELHRDKAPGQLSSIVVFAQLLGTVARVFTTLTETDDQLLFWGFSLATIFNTIIAVQVSRFKEVPPPLPCLSTLILTPFLSSLTFDQLIMYWNGNELNTKKGRNNTSEQEKSTFINMGKPSGSSKLD